MRNHLSSGIPVSPMEMSDETCVSLEHCTCVTVTYYADI